MRCNRLSDLCFCGIFHRSNPRKCTYEVGAVRRCAASLHQDVVAARTSPGHFLAGQCRTHHKASRKGFDVCMHSLPSAFAETSTIGVLATASNQVLHGRHITECSALCSFHSAFAFRDWLSEICDTPIFEIASSGGLLRLISVPMATYVCRSLRGSYPG